MPLRAWYPLNGNANNMGASNLTLTQTTAPAWSTGKTSSQAMTTGAFKWTAAQSNSIFNNNEFSYACWFYVDAASGTSASDYKKIFGAEGGTNSMNRKFTCGQYPTVNGFHVSSWNGSSLINCCRLDDALPSYKWTHICYSYKKGAINIYINGVLKKTTELTMANSSYSAETPVLWNYSGRRICDVRVYDHALSQKEVTELAKGMIVHYPLASIGDANPNLLTWSKNYTKSTPYTHTSSGKDGYVLLGADTLVTVTPGKLYYIQVKSDGILHSSHATTDGVVTNKFTVWLYIRNTGSSKTAGTGFDSAKCFTSGDAFINDPERHLFVWAWYAPSNAQDITLRLNSYSDGSTAVTLHFWDFKVEPDTYTPYVPSRNSAQYTALGFDSGTVRDATGRGIDLTYSATGYSIVQGSPRYSTAVDFNQSAYLYNSSVPYTLSSFTVAFWFKPRAISTQHFVFGSFDNWCANGMGIWREASKSFYSILIKSDAESGYSSSGGQTFTMDAWNFYAITWDGTTIKVYLNNELKKTETYGRSGNCVFKNLFLGNSAINGIQSSETEEAAMSDFRLYATALSADQVKELYRAPISVANTGTCTAVEISEKAAGISFTKTGVVSGTAVSELPGKYDTKVLIEPDGSCWAHIGHHADPTTYKFASGDPFATGVWKDDRRSLDASFCDNVDKWEFIAKQKTGTSAAVQKFRWVQTKNPNTAVYADVTAANVTKYTNSQGYDNLGSSYGGIYKFNSNTYYVMNNGSNGNWFGAIGCWSSWSSGIPGINGVAVADGGFLDLYIRIDNVTFTNGRTGCSLDKGGKAVLSTEFIEQ